MSRNGPKVIVVGAGVVGASVALHLAEAGARVTIVEAGRPASGASGNSFGWINANFAETPEYFRLRRDALDEMHNLGARLGVGDAIRWNGCFWWEDEGEAFFDHARELSAFGYEARVVDAAEFSRLEPQVAHPPQAAIHSVIEGATDAARLTGILIAAAVDHGARLVTGCDVTGISGTGVDTSLGPINADQVVVAAGAGAGALLACAGIALPMNNRRGFLLRTTPIAPAVGHVIMAPDVHFHQLADGSLILGEIFSGGGLNDGTDPVEFADQMLTRLRRRLPSAADLRVARIGIGTRPVPVDGLPAVGFVPDRQDVYVAAMHSGVTLAPLIGRLAALEILGGNPDPRLASFRPTRFN